ncbi:translation initiation factor IF-2 N-terminal domain-containing protein [Plantactinospora sp. KLBMP9567]|uniref:translation initiation factor IF-2 N-terminal domain-containing protein n=1 Tax=Plantactinospora sp. KLBMP9567 TaxID=3085900 RepID=UPI003990ADA1
MISGRPLGSPNAPGHDGGRGLKVRVYELARELGVSSSSILRELAELGEFSRSASSSVEQSIATRVREAFGRPEGLTKDFTTNARQSSWRSGAVRPSKHPDTIHSFAASRPN